MVDKISAAKEPDRKMSGSRHFRSFLCEAAIESSKCKLESVTRRIRGRSNVQIFLFFLKKNFLAFIIFSD